MVHVEIAVEVDAYAAATTPHILAVHSVTCRRMHEAIWVGHGHSNHLYASQIIRILLRFLNQLLDLVHTSHSAYPLAGMHVVGHDNPRASGSVAGTTEAHDPQVTTLQRLSDSLERGHPTRSLHESFHMRVLRIKVTPCRIEVRGHVQALCKACRIAARLAPVGTDIGCEQSRDVRQLHC